MNKLFRLFLISLIITGCNLPQPADPREEQRLINDVRRQVFTKLKKEKELVPFGTGGQTADGIKMLCLAFLYYKPVDIDTGRKLLIDGLNELVSAVNAEKDIHRYLYNYPFEVKNAEISISIHKSDGTDFGEGKLCIISAQNGILEYLTWNPDKNSLITVFSETYEEALQRINSSEI